MLPSIVVAVAAVDVDVADAFDCSYLICSFVVAAPRAAAVADVDAAVED